MRLGVLFSGGKDSCYALELASEEHEISCLITVNSDNKDSYMFHTPAIEWTKFQAESIGIPHLFGRTPGVEEDELEDLKTLIKKAILDYEIEGIVTGAIASVYQSTRIQKICADLNLWCFNPLWQSSQTDLLLNLISGGYEICITAVAADYLDESWLGKQITIETISELLALANKHKINPAGEGGEFETFVLNSPLFKKKLTISDSLRHFSRDSGRLEIKGLD
tara:strand:- start:1993 stop:2661 length:669 start_codon:yes stop_codon:yes gene_type:complete